MAEFRRAGDEAIPTFHLGDSYTFKHFFDDKEVFSKLSKYYIQNEGRFRIPEDDLDDVRSLLKGYSYALVIQSQIDEYVVAKKRYTDHPDVLFKQSVARQKTSDYTLFLMKDRDAVEQACRQGAIPVAEIDATFTA